MAFLGQNKLRSSVTLVFFRMTKILLLKKINLFYMTIGENAVDIGFARYPAAKKTGYQITSSRIPDIRCDRIPDIRSDRTPDIRSDRIPL